MQEHTVSCLYVESIENTIGDLMSMVSTWRMIRSAVFVSVLVISVELAQPCMVLWYGAFIGCFTAPVVLQRAATTTHLAAHVPSCALGYAPIAGYVCSPHGMLLLGSNCRGAGQNRVFPQSCVSNQKKNWAYAKIKSKPDDFLRVLDT